MDRRIAIFLGHPDADSFCGALAGCYRDAAKEGGAHVRHTEIGGLHFDPILHKGYKAKQPLEPDLRRAQRDIHWADHLVFVYPVWWGSMPALLKGFIDRVFQPGFGFRFVDKRAYRWESLLAGRSARLILTMDAPPWLAELVYNNPGISMMKGMTLEFCGIRPVGVTQFGPVKRATRARRLLWKMEIEELGWKGI